MTVVRELEPGDDALVAAASSLFDGPAAPGATAAFLADDRHHLLVAYEGTRPVGFVSGVEVTHPDKGTEMFLYELAVDQPFQRRGIGRGLVEELAAVARTGRVLRHVGRDRRRQRSGPAPPTRGRVPSPKPARLSRSGPF